MVLHLHTVDGYKNGIFAQLLLAIDDFSSQVLVSEPRIHGCVNDGENVVVRVGLKLLQLGTLFKFTTNQQVLLFMAAVLHLLDTNPFTSLLVKPGNTCLTF